MRSEYFSIALIALGIGLLFPAKVLADEVHTSAVVTRSLVVKTGWEAGLIQRDPSLAHWHWNAMSSYTSDRVQSAVPTTTQTAVRQAAPQPVQTIPMVRYQKPNHAPLPYVCHDPVRIPPRERPVATGLHHQITETKTSLSYSTKRPDAAAATYRQGYQNSAGTAPHTIAYSSQANVHGRLIDKHL